MRSRTVSSFLAVLTLAATAALAPAAHAAAPVTAPSVQVMTVTPQMAAHVMLPAHVANVRSDRGEPVAPRLQARPVRPGPGLTKVPQLDINAFGTALNTQLKTAVTGYALQIRQNGNVVGSATWNWSETPTDGSKAWNFDTRMHIASVSKLMTGMALYKLLDVKGISPDAAIAPYLPAYWTKGSNVNKITFRNLMMHESGFHTGGSGSDFMLMKSKVAAGVTAVGDGTYGYENMNYGLCRILLSVINGDVGVNAQFPPALMDQAWDYTTITSYERFMQANLFHPANVQDASLASGAGDVRAYGYYPDNGKGWDSGDLTSMAGGAAWHMTVNDVMNVLSTFRRGNILPAAKAETALESYFGIDATANTIAGPLFTKNGLWTDGVGHTEQDVIFFLPHNMELALFVNSPVGKTPSGQGGPGVFLSGLVQQAYVQNLH